MIQEELERRLNIATEALEEIRTYFPYAECKCEGHRVADIALREIDQSKWTFQKVEDAMRVIIDKHVKGHTWEGINNARPEIEALMVEAAWDEEEYHWESIRHHENNPSLCACWDKHPENEGQNPSPL